MQSANTQFLFTFKGINAKLPNQWGKNEEIIISPFLYLSVHLLFLLRSRGGGVKVRVLSYGEHGKAQMMS